MVRVPCGSRPPDTKSCKSFLPAFHGHPKAPGEMTGRDILNDLIDQYGRRLRQVLHPAHTSDGQAPRHADRIFLIFSINIHARESPYTRGAVEMTASRRMW